MHSRSWCNPYSLYERAIFYIHAGHEEDMEAADLDATEPPSDNLDLDGDLNIGDIQNYM